MKIEFRTLNSDLEPLNAVREDIESILESETVSDGHVDLYTGRKDSSRPRKKIFNHDVVKDNTGHKYEVRFTNGAFRLVEVGEEDPITVNDDVLTKALINELGLKVVSTVYGETADDEDEDE